MKTTRPWLLMTVFISLISMSCLASFPGADGYDIEQSPQRFDRSERLADLAADLENRAVDIVAEISNQFFDRNQSYDRNRSWSDDQIEVLFASETFAASARVFQRLAERDRGYDSRYALRQGMERAYRYLLREFDDLEAAARRGRIQVYALSDCSSTLRRIEREIGTGGGRQIEDVREEQLGQDDWVGKYVKGSNSAVYLIERRADGSFVRRPFKNLESLFKYNFDQDRGDNPWGHIADIPAETFSRMRTGDAIERTFEGMMIIEEGTRANRPVYFIQGGKKRGLTKPELVTRYGGWKKVFTVPIDIINQYPNGEPIY